MAEESARGGSNVVSKVRLICGNCGKEEEFDNWDEPFDKGWDTVRDFGYNACEECPGVSVYFPMMYAQEARATTDPDKKAELLEKAAEATMKFKGLNWKEALVKEIDESQRRN